MCRAAIHADREESPHPPSPGNRRANDTVFVVLFSPPERPLTIYRFVIHLRWPADARPCRRTEVGMRGMQCHAAPHLVILVVEDNQSFRRSMQKILEEADFLVLPAANADQALELAQSCSGPIDLLLTTL